MTRRHVVITGLMGVGKTTTAEAVGAALALPVRDSDVDIVTLFGCTGADIASRRGIDELHRSESAVLLGALAEESPLVIAAAAWVVEDPMCRRALERRAVTIVLTATVDQLVARASSGDHRRGMDRTEFEALAGRRAPMFAEVATALVDASLPPVTVVAEVLVALRTGRTNSGGRVSPGLTDEIARSADPGEDERVPQNRRVE